METILHDKLSSEPQPVFWRSPSLWFAQYRLNRSFWIFFGAAFFFDAGFAVYYFLFNLYLVDFHFTERAVGFITGAGTLGAVAGTLPAGLLARRFGLRPVLIACFTAAPVLGILRAEFVSFPLQVGLAFVGGIAMCLWGVCFLPAVARLTNESNRAAAFSLIFSVSIGTGALGSLLCGYLPGWLHAAGFVLEPYQVKRAILVGASLVAFLGLAFVLRLRMPEQTLEDRTTLQWRTLLANRFVRKTVVLIALWSAVIAAFTPFAGVWLTRTLHLSLERIGAIFALSQVIQLCVGLLTAPLFRALGLRRGVASTQVVAAVLLLLLATAHQQSTAAILFLIFSAAQWMCSPGLYNYLMSGTPDAERSTVAAFAMFLNALVASAATAAAGAAITRSGYPAVFVTLGVIALAVAAWMAYDGKGQAGLPQESAS
jgi:MFS family permease